jgi:alkylation response protein AidB-like acyl-CoA dehydrogenase
VAGLVRGTIGAMSTVTEAQVQADVTAWLAQNWDRERPLGEWRMLLADSGWAVASWPEDWHGRGLPSWADRVVASAINDADAVGPPLGSGISLAAPTILAHGSDELKRRVLYPTITGEVSWCQLFSEPGAGSDLAGLSTTAVRDGDDWIVNGQKVWNTSAHHADYAMLVARTDWSVPKHQGISYFVLPMHQPGVEVRPIVQMNCHESFNEVFLADARIPAANIVGQPGEGWRAARTTLMHERTFSTLRGSRRTLVSGRAQIEAEAEAEAEEYFKVYAWYPQRGGRSELAIPRAQQHGVSGHPILRQELAALYSFTKANEWTAKRALAARSLGRPPGPEGSLGKLARSEVARRSALAHTRISGAAAMLAAGTGHHDDVAAEILISTPAQSIAGGTDEIQRNIIGENILGLPREPSADRDQPFSEVRRS